MKSRFPTAHADWKRAVDKRLETLGANGQVRHKLIVRWAQQAGRSRRSSGTARAELAGGEATAVPCT
jgi:hypothetical protein